MLNQHLANHSILQFSSPAASTPQCSGTTMGISSPKLRSSGARIGVRGDLRIPRRIWPHLASCFFFCVCLGSCRRPSRVIFHKELYDGFARELCTGSAMQVKGFLQAFSSLAQRLKTSGLGGFKNCAARLWHSIAVLVLSQIHRASHTPFINLDASNLTSTLGLRNLTPNLQPTCNPSTLLT